jgi:hypothetical protein
VYSLYLLKKVKCTASRFNKRTACITGFKNVHTSLQIITLDFVAEAHSSGWLDFRVLRKLERTGFETLVL